MPDIKNYDKIETEKDLKRADAEKSSATVSQLASISLKKARKGEDSGFKSNRTVRKRLPIVVDIIIALVFVAIFAGAVVGAFYAFRAFAVDFESVNVEYTVFVPNAQYENYAGTEHQVVYFEKEDNGSVEYYGKIKSISAQSDGVLITITSTVSYREGDGYSIGEYKLAVGQNFELRTEYGLGFSGIVVELVDERHPAPVEESLAVAGTILAVKGGR